MPLVGIICLSIVLRQGSVRDRQGAFTLTSTDLVIQSALDSLQNLKPAPGPGDKILVESDPFGSQWEDLFLFRVVFDSPRLQVKRPSQLDDNERREDAQGQWRHISWDATRWVYLPRY
jgi:hypothetical protein